MRLLIRTGPQAGESVTLPSRQFVIGRGEEADLRLFDDRASRQHTLISRRHDGEWEVRDLGSTNGTLLDGVPIRQPMLLRPGSQLQVGETAMTAIAEAAPIAPDHPAAERPKVLGYRRGGSAVGDGVRPRRLPAWGLVTFGVLAALVVTGGVVAALLATGTIGGSGGEAPTSTSTPASVPELVQRFTPSVGAVIVQRGGEAIGNGSGWVLDAAEGLLVTNAHVILAGDSFQVRIAGATRDAEVVGVSPCEDLAVLRLADRGGLQTLPLGSQEALRLGESVLALGFPGSASRNLQLTPTTGVVSVVKTSFDLDAADVPKYPNLIQTDAAINPGDSGGPLISVNQAAIVGVNSASLPELGGRPIQDQGYAIGIERARAVLSALRAGQSPGWSGAGFTYPESAEQLSNLGLPFEEGLIIETAVPGTSAADAGLGDSPVLLTAVDGVPMNGGIRAYCDAVAGTPVGTDVDFTFVRAGSQTEETLPARIG